MPALNPPDCQFGDNIYDFALLDINGRSVSLIDYAEAKALLIMFICNHCPYVQSILPELVSDCRELQSHGVETIAIMPNDIDNYPDDHPDRMKEVSQQFDFSFPYLFDETQEVAKKFGAVCTPDFFGYNAEQKLQYRGRFDASGMQRLQPRAERDLFNAMLEIAATGKGPKQQKASIGCSIKWR